MWDNVETPFYCFLPTTYPETENLDSVVILKASGWGIEHRLMRRMGESRGLWSFILRIISVWIPENGSLQVGVSCDYVLSVH